MKPRYKTGDKVKLYKSIHPLDREYVGKLFTIKSYYEGCSGGNWYTVKENNIGYREDQLKKFAPSRTGTRDPKTGRFVSKEFYGYNFTEEEFLEEKIKNTKMNNYLDSKQRNYQKILGELICIQAKQVEIEKKIDELGRRV